MSWAAPRPAKKAKPRLELRESRPRRPTSAPADQGQCVKATSPRVARAQARARRRADRAIAAELRRRGLVRLLLSKEEQKIHRGVRPGGAAVKPRPPGKGEFIAGPQYWQLSGGTQEDWQFVRNGQGEVFRLVLKGETTGADVLSICGCPRPSCRYGSGCPGCGYTVKVWYGPLPEEMTYKGPLTLSYKYRDVRLEHTRSDCQVRCPPPPPRMRSR